MSNKPGSITILQLTRFGDILQTLWAVKDIKSENPDLKLNLVTRERFGKPLEFLLKKSFDNIHYLDCKKLMTTELTEGVNSTVETINSWKSNVVVNLSFSKTSAYLTSLIEADFKLGLTSNEFGGVQANGSWSEYIYSTVMRGPLNPFSLVDIFKLILGSKTKNSIPERNFSGQKIVFHPFASQKRKAWTTSKWSEIFFRILKKNPETNLLVVGGSCDKIEAEKIRSNPLLEPFKDQIRIECGSLSMDKLYEELQSSFLFCGHDSMVGHMASLTGVQSLTLSLGTVRPAETSPYGLNNYILSPRTPCFPCFPDEKCDDLKCHKDLSYQIVSESIQQLIDSHEIQIDLIKENVSPLHLSTVDIFRTGFSASGLLQLNSISSNNASPNELYRTFYKIIWLFMLEGIEESSGYPKLNTSTVLTLEKLTPNLKQLFELAEFGKKYSRFILDEISKDQPDIQYIKNCGEKIEEIDEMKVLVGKACPVLNPIIDFFNLKKTKMQGTNLVELCSSSHEIYSSVSSFCNIFFDLVDKTVNEHKISNKNDSMKEAKE